MATASLAEARNHNVPPEVFLRHYREIRDAKDAHAETGMALARLKKAAKASGIDLDALKMLEKFAALDDDEAEMQLQHFAVYARWLELPIGTQLDIFGKKDVPQPREDARQEHQEWTAAEAGLAAGKKGELRDANPNTPGDAEHVAWDKAWLKGHKVWMKGQGKIAGEMGQNAGQSTGRKRAGNGARATAH